MMKLSLGMGKIVSIVKFTTDKNAKITNSSVTSYTIAGVEVGSVANQLLFILADFASARKVLQCHTISLFVEIFENQPNPGYCKNCAVLLGRFAIFAPNNAVKMRFRAVMQKLIAGMRERQLRYLHKLRSFTWTICDICSKQCSQTAVAGAIIVAFVLQRKGYRCSYSGNCGKLPE